MPAPKDPVKYAEYIQKLRDSHKGQIPTNLEQIKNYNLGKKFTQEHKDKIRQAQIGKKKNISLEGRERMRIKNYPVWNKGLKGYNSGNKNGRWLSDRTKLKKSDRQGGSAYTEWREKCKTRDKKKCKINNKDCKGKLEVHHILRFIDFPELRYDVSNGITLCHFHHPRKSLEEKKLVSLFRELLSQVDS